MLFSSVFTGVLGDLVVGCVWERPFKKTEARA